MKKFLCFVMLAVMTVSFAGIALAGHHDERFVRDEAARRNMTLIPLEEAQRIAREKIGNDNVRFKDADLEDEDDYYRKPADFRPVWSLEAVSGANEYDIDIDAVTGEVLKFKLDD